MTVLESILRFLNTSMEVPEPFGWFHLLWFAISIAAGVLLCLTHKKGDDRRVRRVVFIVAVIVAVLEIYKQINFTFIPTDDGISSSFQWYAFPFQFCSMPMYVGLLTGIFRKGRVHDALMAFLSTYAIFAGCCVMFYPVTIFVPAIGINIQTMVCHGSMLTVGIYLWYSGYVKPTHKTALRAMAVFGIAVSCAVILNEIAHLSGLLEEHTFNMFFISPYCEPSLPVYSIIQGVVPFPLCLILYFIGFSAAAYAIVLVVMGIKALLLHIKERKQQNEPSAQRS